MGSMGSKTKEITFPKSVLLTTLCPDFMKFELSWDGNKLLDKVMCEVNIALRWYWGSALRGVVSKTNDSNCFSMEDKSKHFHEVTGVTSCNLTVSWANTSCSIGWGIVPMLAIVQRKIKVHIKEPTKGYMAAIVSKLKQLSICLWLSVSCYIVLVESIKPKSLQYCL